jgi:DNA-binding NtrC family response regulator
MDERREHSELTAAIDGAHSGQRVLIVHTDQPFARLLQSHLTLQGWSAQACTGREAVRDLSRLRPDAVVMDFDDADLDAFDLLSSMRAEFPRMHVIVCSHEPEPSGAAAEVWQSLRIARFIRRPCALDSIDAVLRDVCCEASALPQP